MGAGFLPVSFKNGKLMLLFGKERDRPNETARGWADFGGGTEPGESMFENACREGSEELSGFLGSKKEIKKLMNKSKKHIINYDNYKTYMVLIDYDEKLPHYFNNQSEFLETYHSKNILFKSTMYEKEQIKWFSLDELKKNKSKFRNFYQNIVSLILKNKKEIINKLQNKKTIRKNKKFKKTRKKY
jgi:8-oxo-dGTP pyrophosphatase MutT (NUDIX family)